MNLDKNVCRIYLKYIISYIKFENYDTTNVNMSFNIAITLYFLFINNLINNLQYIVPYIKMYKITC